MKPGGWQELFRTTTFRLAMAQAAVFTLFASALLAYVYLTTTGQLTRDAEAAANDEFLALTQVYVQGGLRDLNQEVIERQQGGSGQFLYVLADPRGETISGDFALPEAMMHPPALSDEIVLAVDVGQSGGVRRARGRVGRLLGGPILLVARDMYEAQVIMRRISSAVWTGAVLGLLFSLLSGVLASRQAVQRIQSITRTTREVMTGDLSRRAPSRQQGDEFDALADAMNAMLARLEKLVHSTRNAGDAIAHDLRTPLARLKQRLEQALDRETPDPEQDREALRAAAAETEQVLATFSAVLKLSRLQTASDWQFERVDVSAVLEQLAEFYGPAGEDAGIVLDARIAPGLSVKGDRSLITQAVANLLENALKYTPAQGRVLLSAQSGGGGVEVAVADNGPGIPAADRERVIERFVRLEAARSSPGSGLGLSLVAAVAELHRGALRLEDGLSGGAGPGLTARLLLPAARAGMEAPRHEV